jgi:hypothetical protein
VYVGDYAGGQQYYSTIATSSSNFASSSSSTNSNTNGNSYNIVPVDDLSQARGSPQTITSSVSFFFCYKKIQIF